MRTRKFDCDHYLGIHKTICVTFPRSGHHVLQRALSLALSFRLSYSEYYAERAPHIGQTDAINFQKTHDFECDLAVEDRYRYVVQYREPEESIASWFDLEVFQGLQPDTEEAYLAFRNEKQDYLKTFRDFWVKPAPRRLLVDYADLCRDFAGTVERVIEHIAETKNWRGDGWGEFRRFAETQKNFKPRDMKEYRYA